mgnify:CR=1 FL=1
MSRKSRRQRKQKAAARLDARWIAFAAIAAIAGQIAFLFFMRMTVADHHARQAQVQIAAARYPGAAESARRALTLNARQGEAAYFLGVALQNAGRHDEAVAHLRLAADTMGHRARAIRYLAQSEEALGRNEDAIAHYRRSLAMVPLPPESRGQWRARLGRLLLAEERVAEGLACFRHIVSNWPDSRFPFEALALGYESLGAGRLALNCATVLLLTGSLAPRAVSHIERIARQPDDRAPAAEALRAVRDRYEAGEPARAAIDRALGSFADVR